MEYVNYNCLKILYDLWSIIEANKLRSLSEFKLKLVVKVNQFKRFFNSARFEELLVLNRSYSHIPKQIICSYSTYRNNILTNINTLCYIFYINTYIQLILTVWMIKRCLNMWERLYSTVQYTEVKWINELW